MSADRRHQSYPGPGITLDPHRRPIVPVAKASTEPATPPAPKDAQTDEQIVWLRRRVEALERLLTCYRMGTSPSGSLFAELALTRQHTTPGRSDG